MFAIWLGIKTVVNIVKPPVTATNIDVGNFDLKAPKAGMAAGGGGGGGSHDIVDPIKGNLPPRMKDPITPPDDSGAGQAQAGDAVGDQCAAEYSSCRITRTCRISA